MLRWPFADCGPQQKNVGVVGMRGLLSLELADFISFIADVDFIHDFGAGFGGNGAIIGSTALTICAIASILYAIFLRVVLISPEWTQDLVTQVIMG